MFTKTQPQQFPSAAKGMIVSLLVLLVLLHTGGAQLTPPVEDREKTASMAVSLTGSQWKWNAANGGFTSTITFAGTKIELGWGGSIDWAGQSDGSLLLHLGNGKVATMRFDSLFTTFRVESEGKQIAWGGRSSSRNIGSPDVDGLAGAPTAKTLTLKAGWDTPMQGGSKTHRDLSVVLNDFATASNEVKCTDDIEIFRGVKYLMPIEEAVKVLGISQRLPSMKKVVCPGFPRDTLNYVSFDGLFDGQFKRIDIVVDAANQVVTVQLVDEAPKKARFTPTSLRGEWLTYNFIGYRVKAMTYLQIEYRPEVYIRPFNEWRSLERSGVFMQKEKPMVLRVDSVLLSKDRKQQELVRWYVPKPFASVILHCIQRGQ